MQAASKKIDRTADQVKNMTNSRSGLKELKKEMMKLKDGEVLYDKMARDKIKQILYKGKVQHKITGTELYDTINTGENYSILSELLGETEAKELLIKSKEIGDKAFTGEMLKKAGTKIFLLKSLHTFGII